MCWFFRLSVPAVLENPHHSAISQSLSAFEGDYPSSLQTVAETITIDSLILLPHPWSKRHYCVSYSLIPSEELKVNTFGKKD
jgi:hypothetical protein